MSFITYGFVMRLLGATIAGGRALSALIGTTTIATTFLLARRLGGDRLAWPTTAVMAFSAYHIHYSRLASNQVADPLFGTLALWLVLIALQPRRALDPAGDRVSIAAWGLAGVVAGLGWYAYFGARWVTILIPLVAVSYSGLQRHVLARHWRGVLLFALGWLVAALPILGWYSLHPSSLTERYRAVSIFASGWLAREVEITGMSRSALLLQQAWRAITAFHIRSDPTYWYRPDQPLVDFVTGALMLLGSIDLLVKVRWPSRRVTAVWFVSTIAMAWGVTENPPSSQRGLLLMPIVAVLAANGLQLLVRLLGSTRWHVLALAFLAAIAVLNVSFYFVEYTPRRVYGNPTAEAATAFARYTLANPAPVCETRDASVCPGRVYFYGPPVIYWKFGTLAYMLRGFPGEDVPDAGAIPETTDPARFAFVPERADELAAVQVRYPGGAEARITAPDGRLLMLLYDWPSP
jgi:4-amino-4-deoxy-L-arabinose transferase-like glycosyltransferase